MNRINIEQEPIAISRSAFFYCRIKAEVKKMQDWTDRLIRCGIPEKTAQRVVNYLFRKRRTMELVAYVRMTEEAMGRR